MVKVRALWSKGGFVLKREMGTEGSLECVSRFLLFPGWRPVLRRRHRGVATPAAALRDPKAPAPPASQPPGAGRRARCRGWRRLRLASALSSHLHSKRTSAGGTIVSAWFATLRAAVPSQTERPPSPRPHPARSAATPSSKLLPARFSQPP